MNIEILKTPAALGEAAAEQAATCIREAHAEKGHVNVILATGASQFETLKALVTYDLPWKDITMFHLDEYINLPEDHPASFRKYLKERFLEEIDYACAYHLIDGNRDPEVECSRVSELISRHPIDVALIGIGENGHLAFNDPPADFETDQPYIVVDLDENCRKQQFGEGWFNALHEVPRTAISMSVRQIMKSKNLIVSVPDLRKASAVQRSIEGPKTNMCPASILREHPSCTLFLDKNAASLLTNAHA